jgi:hypothetical protein
MSEEAHVPFQGIPKEITGHFRRSLDSMEQLADIIGLSRRSIATFRSMPQAMRALAKATGESDSEVHKERLAWLEKDAALAAKEVANDFATLHGFAVVALWSWLEWFTRDLVALWLVHKRESFLAPAFQKLRIQLGKYMQLDPTEQAQYVVEMLEAEVYGGLKRGVNRFEVLLEPLGIGGAVDDKLQRDLYELQQVRNVLAHRAGRADRAFVEACPWFPTKVGEQVQVNAEASDRYGNAAGAYLLTVLYRVGDLHGQDLRVGPPEGGESEGDEKDLLPSGSTEQRMP